MSGPNFFQDGLPWAHYAGISKGEFGERPAPASVFRFGSLLIALIDGVFLAVAVDGTHSISGSSLAAVSVAWDEPWSEAMRRKSNERYWRNKDRGRPRRSRRAQ